MQEIWIILLAFGEVDCFWKSIAKAFKKIKKFKNSIQNSIEQEQVEFKAIVETEKKVFKLK